MGESFRDDVALGAFLQRVVADLRGGVQAFLDVARFENLALAVGEAGPDAGEAVSLQLEPYGECIGLRSRARLWRAWTLPMMPSRFCTWWPTSWATA